MTAFLLSMQAAGMITSLWENKSKSQQIQQGRALEKAAIDANLESLNYEAAQQSVDSIRQLRQNVGAQIVMQAARGNASTETTVGLSNSSVHAFNQDEQTRRMNLLAKEANLRASNVLSGLHTLQSETQLGRNTLKLFEAFPASSAFDEFRRSNLGKKWGFGLKEVQ